MKKTLLYLVILSCCINTYCQDDSIMNFIFIPHPRSEDRNQQSVLPAIEKIDFSRYDMILLGGDLTYYTSISHKSLDYCDSLFNLKSPNTLWTFGNHDLQDRGLIKEYTGRESYYSWFKDNCTFLVLDTELDANGFASDYISGNQLDMIKSLCDTISVSDYLILLHHRLMWMIGNNDFDSRIDSVGESTRQLDTTNFYQEIYPLLQKVKKKGVSVICLGGDKSKINIEYSPEDSITFFAATMAPEFSDSQNDVLIFNYDNKAQNMTWEFVPLDKVEKNKPDELHSIPMANEKHKLTVWQGTGLKEINILIQSDNTIEGFINIYASNGVLYKSIRLVTNEKKTIFFDHSGVYFIAARYANSIQTKKVFVK